MTSGHEAEIRASVAAHQDLGPGYDEAVAEGLVERIGAEIDKRIDARLGSRPGGPGAGGAPDYRAPGGQPPPPGGPPGTAGPGPHGYQAPAGYRGYQGPMLPPGYQLGPPPSRPPAAGTRSVATTITALGSIALGVAATAIVTRGGKAGAQAVMVLLVWAAIAVINVAYARRH